MRPVLQGATAAGPEVRADRLNPLRARLQHLDQFTAFAAAYGQDPFARQG